MPIHSHTALKQYQNCPRQYHEVRVLKRFPYVQTAEAEFGDRAHKALELCGRNGTPLPAEFAAYQWAIDDIVRKLPGTLAFEYEFNFTRTGQKCGGRDWKNKFWTGKADVVAVDMPRVVVIDWKTGKSKYPDKDQLELMAIFTFMEFPEVQEVHGFLVFLNDAVTVATVHKREQFQALYSKHYGVTRDIDADMASGGWKENPSPLCPWCPVTECPNWKPKPEKR